MKWRCSATQGSITTTGFATILAYLQAENAYTDSVMAEWCDPRKEDFYFYMKSYCPVDNIKAVNCPLILVTAGLHDPRVLYSEPAKYMAKLRDMKTDDNVLLFKCELGSGHFSKSGRQDWHLESSN
ncbi:uncharacterized protein LOC132303111 isoform X2 [Cornus florida]|uniref:uncharacterized protein LOC132303111 isoform X2 n=1 Tax=Cornus florida TaxID=4283 RepID=UPI0028986581|nr:uncharacterized protein LOC132303111 isoform X2 [Cornus florida]